MKYQVRMLKSQLGVDDGKLHPDNFVEGEEYAIGEDLYRAFVDMGIVELVGAEKKPRAEDRETKIASPEEAKTELADMSDEAKQPKSKRK
jgi:hypothetical protein